MKTITTLILTIASVFIVSSCGKGETLGVSVSEDVFKSHINSKSLPSDVNLNSDKSFLNREYPIEIALYENGKWYYDLPNLGTGTGTYKYEDGRLKLHSPRKLFDINIDVVAEDEEGKAFYLSFRDRHGFRTIKTELMNRE